MRLSTLRWRLPLSYAGIALLATLALGGILLSMLGAYYQERERDYLRANAAAVAAQLAPLIGAGEPPATLQAQVRAYAFLLQSRVQVRDAGRGLTIDSGPPSLLSVEIGSLPAPGGAGAALADTAQILVRPSTSSAASPLPDAPQPPQPPAPPTSAPLGTAPAGPGAGPTSLALAEDELRRQATAIARQEAELQLEATAIALSAGQSLGRTLYGFNLGPEAARDTERSPAVETAPIRSPADGSQLGEVRFSDGPAYGREIVLRVAWSLVLAGLLATALGALAGWLVSRQVTGPLATLAAATERMAAGDLAIRVEQRRRDEIGQLAGGFNAMAGRVEGTVQTLRRFVADAAHELNTPLTALQANLDLAHESADPAEAQRYVVRASADAERMAQLARSLLQLSRLEVAADHPAREPLDLAGLVRDLADGYAARAEQAAVQFQVTTPPHPVVVRASAPQLRQALGNIVANAVKFTPAGGRVSVEVAEEPGWATVRVADSGIGIPADEIPLLFERFHRGRNANAYPGSGLGLAIARTIVEGHGGAVRVESDGAGSRFTVRLPA